MKLLKACLEWLVWSSANPQKLSLTVRGALLALVPTFLGIVSAACGFGVVCLGVDEQGLNQLVEGFVALVQAFFALIAAGVFLWGLIRKIVLSAG